MPNLKLIAIPFSNRIPNGMETERSIDDVGQDHVVRQPGVDGHRQGMRRRSPDGKVAACYLSECVNARIGAAATSDFDIVTGSFLNGVLQGALHRSLFGLDLPSGEIRAVVRDRQAKCPGHAFNWPPATASTALQFARHWSRRLFADCR